MMMGEFFLALFIFIGIMAITALVFGGWVIATVFKGIGNLIFGSPRRARNMPATVRGQAPPALVPPMGVRYQSVPAGWTTCATARCRTPNPAGARYCRRCGHPLPEAAAVTVTRREAV